MEGSTNRCTKVQWRKGSCKDHFWKRSKFFVKSRIMASSCHNLNIQIGLQRNRLGGVGRRWSARQISKSWIQTGKQFRLIWSIDICWLFACYSTPSSSTGLSPRFAKKLCVHVCSLMSNCSTGTSHPLTVAFHLQIGRRLKHICPSSQHSWLLYLFYTAKGATILVL